MIANRVPHEKLPCLQPCTRVLACGHKCSGVCTDPCRCCDDCDEFKTLEAEWRTAQLQRMAQLQLEAPPLPSSTTPPPFPQPTRDSSPEKWAEFSKNPQVHDDAIRKAQLLALKPLVELDTPTTAAQTEKNMIKERFIPISNRDGVRVVNKPSQLRERQTPKVSAQADNQNGGPRHSSGKQQRPGPQTRNHDHAPFKGNRIQTASGPRNRGNMNARANGQRSQVQSRPTLQQGKPNQRRQKPPAPPNNSPMAPGGGGIQSLINFLDAGPPAGRQATLDSMSLMGESDLGFEAEVLGIRRGGHRIDRGTFKTNTVPDGVQEHMGIDAESLMSFGADGADSPAEAATTPKDEKEEELLIEL